MNEVRFLRDCGRHEAITYSRLIIDLTFFKCLQLQPVVRTQSDCATVDVQRLSFCCDCPESSFVV